MISGGVAAMPIVEKLNIAEMTTEEILDKAVQILELQGCAPAPRLKELLYLFYPYRTLRFFDDVLLGFWVLVGVLAQPTRQYICLIDVDEATKIIREKYGILNAS